MDNESEVKYQHYYKITPSGNISKEISIIEAGELRSNEYIKTVEPLKEYTNSYGKKVYYRYTSPY